MQDQQFGMDGYNIREADSNSETLRFIWQHYLKTVFKDSKLSNMWAPLLNDFFNKRTLNIVFKI